LLVNDGPVIARIVQGGKEGSVISINCEV